MRVLSCCDERSVRDYLIVITGADYSRVRVCAELLYLYLVLYSFS